jgi:protease-4
MRRVGVNEEIVALDEGASMSALGRAWSSGQKATIQGFVDSVYDRFTAHVSASRHIPMVDVLKLAGGRVWSGEQAVANRLVDRLGGLGDALAMVAKEAGLEPGHPVTHLPRAGDAFAVLLRDMMDAKALLPDPLLRVVARRIGGLERALGLLLESLTNEKPCRTWVLMPESIELR